MATRSDFPVYEAPEPASTHFEPAAYDAPEPATFVEPVVNEVREPDAWAEPIDLWGEATAEPDVYWWDQEVA